MFSFRNQYIFWDMQSIQYENVGKGGHAELSPQLMATSQIRFMFEFLVKIME